MRKTLGLDSTLTTLTFLKFLLAVFLIQVAAVVLTLATAIDQNPALWWQLALPLGVVAVVAAFWLSSLAAHHAIRKTQHLRMEMEQERERFAREREARRVKAEKDKTRLVRQSHKEIARESRRAHSRANLKVGAALAAAAAAGVIMMAANFLTLGLLTLTGVGGALGGYLLNRHQTSDRSGVSSDALPRGPLQGLLSGKPNAKESRDAVERSR
jgi:ABC-type multidrug transport system fused ATPase/permease subunit